MICSCKFTCVPKYTYTDTARVSLEYLWYGKNSSIPISWLPSLFLCISVSLALFFFLFFILSFPIFRDTKEKSKVLCWVRLTWGVVMSTIFRGTNPFDTHVLFNFGIKMRSLIGKFADSICKCKISSRIYFIVISILPFRS